MRGRSFVGIDLAWKPDKNVSGIAVIHESDSVVNFIDVRSVHSLQEVKDMVSEHRQSTQIIAVDAPLIVINTTGSRPGEILLSKAYGANHASCYPSNLTLFKGKPASASLAEWLEEQGFKHAPGADAGANVMMEVYPHAAHIALRNRKYTIKYKKGSTAQKCEGLREVQRELRAIFDSDVPVETNATSEQLLSKDPATLRGTARKSFEDELDSMLCAYIAYRYAKLGRDAFDVFGDATHGYIVNPKRLPLTDERA